MGQSPLKWRTPPPAGVPTWASPRALCGLCWLGSTILRKNFVDKGALMSSAERARLESISNVSLYAAGCEFGEHQYAFKVLRRHMVGDSILELRPAEGVMTELSAQAPGKN